MKKMHVASQDHDIVAPIVPWLILSWDWWRRWNEDDSGWWWGLLWDWWRRWNWMKMIVVPLELAYDDFEGRNFSAWLCIASLFDHGGFRLQFGFHLCRLASPVLAWSSSWAMLGYDFEFPVDNVGSQDGVMIAMIVRSVSKVHESMIWITNWSRKPFKMAPMHHQGSMW